MQAYWKQDEIDQGMEPEKIVALTFTNKAAREMKERVQTIVGDKADKVCLMNMHKFCLLLMRNYWQTFRQS